MTSFFVPKLSWNLRDFRYNDSYLSRVRDKIEKYGKSECSDTDSVESMKENNCVKATKLAKSENVDKQLWDSTVARIAKSNNLTISVEAVENSPDEVFAPGDAKAGEKIEALDWTPDAGRALVFGWVLDEM